MKEFCLVKSKHPWSCINFSRGLFEGRKREEVHFSISWEGNSSVFHRMDETYEWYCITEKEWKRIWMFRFCQNETFQLRANDLFCTLKMLTFSSSVCNPHEDKCQNCPMSCEMELLPPFSFAWRNERLSVRGWISFHVRSVLAIYIQEKFQLLPVMMTIYD